MNRQQVYNKTKPFLISYTCQEWLYREQPDFYDGSRWIEIIQCDLAPNHFSVHQFRIVLYYEQLRNILFDKNMVILSPRDVS